MTLTAYYQLRNAKAAGLGFELLTSEPGAFYCAGRMQL